ncbi:rubrerythrin-like domain-containing protein [Haloplanus salilacus]|uniref:rubrerythrin-like domain-containing protein n=1 Tax=Haloplanus salilacus TaxID=2949994 RepID=UPI003CCD691C
MPTTPDPAPCDRDEHLFECRSCGKRLCSSDAPPSCPDCDGVLQNLSQPRPQ